MRHQKKGRKFNRRTGQRKAFLRGLAGNVILREKVVTTEARAKEIKPVVERGVTLGKRGTIAAKKLLLSRFHDPRVVRKLCEELGPRYKGRLGGYTRIVRTGRVRKRDGTETARIEFI